MLEYNFENFYHKSFSIEEKVENLFRKVCFYRKERRMESFVKRFKRQIKLMEKSSKQESTSSVGEDYKKGGGVEISDIARHRTFLPLLKYQSPLHPKNVDPRNKTQVERCIKGEIDYAILLASSSESPFTHPLVQRTYKE